MPPTPRSLREAGVHHEAFLALTTSCRHALAESGEIRLDLGEGAIGHDPHILTSPQGIVTDS